MSREGYLSVRATTKQGKGGGERGGVEREGERDGTWYITVNLSGINLSHKRIGNNKGRKRGVLQRVRGGGKGGGRRGEAVSLTVHYRVY